VLTPASDFQSLNDQVQIYKQLLAHETLPQKEPYEMETIAYIKPCFNLAGDSAKAKQSMTRDYKFEVLKPIFLKDRQE
jgi:hypothetical protein